MKPHRPIDGQRSLFEAEGMPPVKYCRKCGLRLRSPKSIERRLGPTCYREQRAKEATAHAD